MDPVKIRNMMQTDWPEVERIYLSGIAGGNATFEQDSPGWEAWDRNHLAKCRLVANVAGRIYGWAALSKISERIVYSGVAEVSIYLDPGFQGRGIGHELLKTLIGESESAGIWTLQAGIFPENAASIRLHEKNGFRQVGRRERIGKSGDKWRDVLFYERRSEKTGII